MATKTKKKKSSAVHSSKPTLSAKDLLRQRLFMGLAVASLVGGLGYHLLGASHAAPGCRESTIAQGDAGVCVRTLQGIIGAPIDGVFSADTRSRVMVYQDSASLKDSGKVDPQTWTALCYSLNKEFSDRTQYAYAIGCTPTTDAYGQTYYQ